MEYNNNSNFNNTPDPNLNQDEHHDAEITNYDLDKDFKKIIKPRVNPILAAFSGIIGIFLLYQVAGAIILLIFYGIDINSMPAEGLRISNMIGQILFMLIPAIYLTKAIYGNVEFSLRMRKFDTKMALMFALGLLVLIPFMDVFTQIQEFLFNRLAATSPVFDTIKNALDTFQDQMQGTYGKLLSMGSLGEALFVVFVVAIVPAVSEEVLFRGYIQRSFEFSISPIWAAIITGIFFSLNHLNPYGFIPLILIGIFLGYANFRSNSIFVPMILHFLNNFTAIMAYIYFGNDEIVANSVDPNKDILSLLMLFLFLGILLTVVIISIERYHKKINQPVTV